MHARPVVLCALLAATLPLVIVAPSQGDTPTPRPSPPARGRTRDAAVTPTQAPAPPATKSPAQPQDASAVLPPLPGGDPAGKPTTTAEAPVVTPGTPAEAKRTLLGVEARLRELDAADPKKENLATRPVRELLERRKQLLGLWTAAVRERNDAEHPAVSPVQVEAESRADLEKTRALLDQAGKAPDGLLPEAFGPPPAGAVVKPPEVRLAEMKEAIDRARVEVKDHTAELAKLRGDGAKPGSGEVATLRAERDKIHQSVSALAAGRAERDAAITNAASPEARELAGDRLTNYEWDYRVETERLAAIEAQIVLASKRAETGAAQLQARASRLELDHRLLEVMERRYASQSEKQQKELLQAVVKEEKRAAQTDDVLERYRAKRSADLLELESKAVAYEKANATTTKPGLSFEEQKAKADETGKEFEKLKKRLTDGNISPLDVLRLKNEFRRIGPLRAAIMRDELTDVKHALGTYEGALADIEMDLVNDDRDDRYDRDALLDKLPSHRRPEAEVMLDAMEVRHRALLHRCQKILQDLAQGLEETQSQILRRLHILDEQYAFVRTHIFWVRDAEPVGLATLDHAQSETVRVARALGKLACEPWDRTLWGRTSPDFVLALVGLVVLPWPLRLARRALDRLRLAAPDPSLTPENAPSAVVG